MPEIGEGGPSGPKERKVKRIIPQEELEKSVQELYARGLPDGMIAARLGVVPDTVKGVRNHLNLPGMTPQKSREARRDYLRKNPNPNHSHEIIPPPIEGLDEE